MEHPLPPLQGIKPAIHSEWNLKKTASDTITKLIDGSGNRIIPPKAYTNSNSLASARTINYALVACHKLRQFFTSTMETRHSSVKHFRQAANERMCYMDTMWAAATMFRSMAENEARKEAEILVDSQQLATALRRVRIQGTFREELELNNPCTGKTPMRNAKQKYEIEDPRIPQDIHHRRKNCTGPPILIVPQSANENPKPKECFLCGSGTMWFCVGCHHYFCMAAKGSNKNRNRELKYSYFKKSMKNGQMTYGNAQLLCWHQAHPQALLGKKADLAQEEEEISVMSSP